MSPVPSNQTAVWAWFFLIGTTTNSGDLAETDTSTAALLSVRDQFLPHGSLQDRSLHRCCRILDRTWRCREVVEIIFSILAAEANPSPFRHDPLES